MEHRQKMVLMAPQGPLETPLPSSVRLHKGEEMKHNGKRYVVADSSHEMSEDGEVMQTTHIVRPMESEARAVDLSQFDMVSVDMK